LTLILFDIDGTLIRNAGGHHRDALAAGIRSVSGLSTTLDGVSTSGMLDRDLIRIMMQNAGASERRIRAGMAQIVAACQTAYLNDCAHDLSDRVCRGAAEFLAATKREGGVLGLVTGNLTRIGWKKVEQAGLRQFFSVGAFAEDGLTRVRLAKVARQRAVKAGLVAHSADVVLIGDHANDVRAAKSNGYVSVAVATGLMPYQELASLEPDILIHDLTELDPKRLLSLGNQANSKRRE
jgi:phosphoglycolate phosphatase